jgi:PAS domain S-box-containing protein
MASEIQINPTAYSLFLEMPALEDIIDCFPLTVTPDTPLVDAIALMSQMGGNIELFPNSNLEQASCVLVADESQLLGIITEHDIVKLTARGVDLGRATVAEVMTQKIIILKQSQAEDVFTVLSLMRQQQIRHLPIVDDRGKLLGLVSSDNAIAALQQQLEQQTAELRQATEDIERRVQERTTELCQVNAQLQQEIEHRKQAEQERQQLLIQEQVARAEAEAAKNRIFNILESITNCFFALDSEWRFTYVNQQATRILQRTPDQLIGRNVWEEFPEAIPLTFYREYHRAVAQQLNVEFEEFYPPLNIWVEVHAYPTVDGLSVYFQDITERKQAEAALRQSEETARRQLAEIEAIYATAPIGLCFIDTELRFVRINEQLAEINGLSVSQHIGRTLREVLPDCSEELEPLYHQVIQSRLPILNYEIQCTTFAQPGIERDWLISLYPLKETDEQVLGVNVMVQEISDLKKAEAALRQNQQQLEAIINNSTAVIYLKDIQGRYLLVNHQYESLCHLTNEQIQGKTDYEIFNQKAAEAFWANDQKVIAAKSSITFEEMVPLDDGTHTYIAVKFPLFNTAGEVYAVCGISTDITEKKQLEAQFLRAQRLESLGTLASGIAHDLNNILSPILVVAQLLPFKLPNLNEQNRELLTILENNSKRGAELVKQILSFAGGAEGKKFPLQLKHLLKEIRQIVTSTFPKSIEIRTHIPTQNLWVVSAEPTQIHQVLMNLCVNARDAMPNGGTLSMIVENFCVDENYARMNLEAKQGYYVLITVSDTGCGIPPELLERIFEPFFTTKEPGKGTGLGLSTVIGIIKNHGGFVEVYSEVGKGSQFKVYLPACDTEVTEENNDFEISEGNGELILIVDDEASIREATKTSLENHNYKVLTANDGIDGLALYIQYKNEISIVLMDIQMPAMNGLTAIRILQKSNPSVKIIAISGIASNQKLLETNDICVQAFLSKPYTMKKLLNTIADVLTRT